jgi:hypothetical protein
LSQGEPRPADFRNLQLSALLPRDATSAVPVFFRENHCDGRGSGAWQLHRGASF